MEINKKKSLWRLGKEQNKEFVNLKLKRWTSTKTLLFGILIAAIIILPVSIIIFQFIELYWYHHPNVMYLFLGFAFALLMLANAISNYVTVKCTKLILPDMENLQEIDAFSIFFYQFLNPWFALFVSIVLVWFGVQAL